MTLHVRLDERVPKHGRLHFGPRPIHTAIEVENFLIKATGVLPGSRCPAMMAHRPQLRTDTAHERRRTAAQLHARARYISARHDRHDIIDIRRIMTPTPKNGKFRRAELHL